MGDDGRRWRASDGEWHTGVPPQGWVRGDGGRWYPPPRGSRRGGRIVLTWRSSALDAAEAVEAAVRPTVLSGSPAYALPAPLVALDPLPASPARLVLARGASRRRPRWSLLAVSLAAAALVVGASLAIAAATSGHREADTGTSTVEVDRPTPTGSPAAPTAPAVPSTPGGPTPGGPTPGGPTPGGPTAPTAHEAPAAGGGSAGVATATVGSAGAVPVPAMLDAAASGSPVDCRRTASDAGRSGDGDGDPGCR